MSTPKDKNELIELNQKYNLWLKPIARLRITVTIAKLKLLPGKTIAASEVIEKIKTKASKPFVSIKVIYTSLEKLQFEGIISNFIQSSFPN